MKKRIVSLVLTFSVLLSMLPMSVLTAFAQGSILYGVCRRCAGQQPPEQDAPSRKP